MKYQKEIKELLEGEHRKEQRDKVVDYVGNDKAKLKALMSFFLDRKWHWRLNQRSAWPIGVIGKKYPNLVKPYYKEMVQLLDDPPHNAAARNVVGLLQFAELEEEWEGEAYAKCFEFLCDPKEAIAVRAFSITVLTRIALKYEDLKPELIAAINEYGPHGSSGIKFRAKKALRELRD